MPLESVRHHACQVLKSGSASWLGVGARRSRGLRLEAPFPPREADGDQRQGQLERSQRCSQRSVVSMRTCRPAQCGQRPRAKPPRRPASRPCRPTASLHPHCVCEPLSRVRFCDPIDSSPPGSSVRGIL